MMGTGVCLRVLNSRYLSSQEMVMNINDNAREYAMGVDFDILSGRAALVEIVDGAPLAFLD